MEAKDSRTDSVVIFVLEYQSCGKY